MLIDGAEICELVGSYILSFLGKVCGIQSVGLYRDDGLACLHMISGPASDKILKDISSDKATFNNAPPSYNDVLSASGYKENLTYQQESKIKKDSMV